MSGTKVDHVSSLYTITRKESLMDLGAEYWCTYCDVYVSNIDTVMKCFSCGEYKGLVKLSPTQTIEEE
jgi:hypothetical protein